MKKILLIIGTVAVLIGLTIYADKVTRVKAKVSDAHDIAKADPVMDKPAPEVTFKDLDGKGVPLSQYKGKVVLVNFWATWCEPCQVEIPWLIEMQQKYSSKGFTILGVDVDDEGNNVVSAYTAKERFNVNGEKLPMNYPILRGDDAVADKFGGLLGYPTSFLISRDGKIVKKVQGLVDYDEIKNAVEGQLDSNSSTQNKTPAPEATNTALAPKVTFKNLDGKDVSLNDYKGKVALVSFFATWCEACQTEIPSLIEMQQKYSPKGFTVLGLDVDSEDNRAVSGYLSKARFDVNGQKVPINYPVLRGNDAVADKFGGLLGYPTSFLISRDGKIVKKVQGLVDYDEIRNAVEGQL
ncbi:MAG TPA: TlpA disulfide reductase family protein [Candidatus Acidoferrum sp.]|nr:TlpA disulfide reductase family protein [Candidatus Acidoferrum sp.]